MLTGVFPLLSFTAGRRSRAVASVGTGTDTAAAAAVAAATVRRAYHHQLLRSRRHQRELILLDRFLQPFAQVLLVEGVEQFLLRLLVLRDAGLRLAVARFDLVEARVRKPLNDGRVPSVERLLRQPGHLVRVGVVVDQLAGEGIDDLNLRAPEQPVDAEVRGLGLVARLRRRHQRQLGLVQSVRRRQALDRTLDTAADGTGKGE